MTERTDAMRTAIAQVFADHATHPSDRGVITTFVVVAEILGDDGEFWLKRISDSSASWRQIGMLTAMLDNLREAPRIAGERS